MYSSVYITTSSKNEAKNIAKELLAMKLIACANIFPIDSIYNWENKLQDDSEYAVIMKTRTELIDELISEVTKLHSYDVPCVVSWSIEAGNRDYLNWIGTETSK